MHHPQRQTCSNPCSRIKTTTTKRNIPRSLTRIGKTAGLAGNGEEQEGPRAGGGSLAADRLDGLAVKASASRAEDPSLRRDFFGVESYQWFKNWRSTGYPAGGLVS